MYFLKRNLWIPECYIERLHILMTQEITILETSSRNFLMIKSYRELTSIDLDFAIHAISSDLLKLLIADFVTIA